MTTFMRLNRTLKLRILMTFIGVLGYSTVGSSMTIYYNHYLRRLRVYSSLFQVSLVFLSVFMVVIWQIGMVGDQFSLSARQSQ